MEARQNTFKSKFPDIFDFTEEDAQVEEIKISEENLKKLCLQKCSVRMWRFNVAHVLSEKFIENCAKKKKEVNEEKKLKCINDYGWHYYKRYYQPREEWRFRQRMHSRKCRGLSHLVELNRMQTKIKLEEAANEDNSESLMETDSDKFEPIDNSDMSEEVCVIPIIKGFVPSTGILAIQRSQNSENFFSGITITSTQQI